MIIEIKEEPRSNNVGTRKTLHMSCDMCSVSFTRRWQKQLVDRQKHCCSMSCSSKLKASDPDFRKRVLNGVKTTMTKSDVKEKFLKAIRDRTNNPEFRKKVSEGRKRSSDENPSQKINASIAAKKLHQDPDYRDKFLKSQRTVNVRKLRSTYANLRWAKQNERKIMSVAMKSAWASPDASLGSPRWIARQSKSQKTVWTKEKRDSVSGLNNSMSGHVVPWWKSWMTDQSNAIKWSNTVKALCGRKCIDCGSTENVEAHHIVPKSHDVTLQFDIKNGIALCETCHRGSENDNSAHALLRSNNEVYVKKMKSLEHRRNSLICPEQGK